MANNLNSFIGTLNPNEVTVVAGTPGSGKTSLALSVALQFALRGKKVAIFSIEMLDKHMIKMLVCQYAEVSLKKFLTGEANKDEWERVKSAAKALSNSNIVVDDSCKITPAEINLKCRRLEEKNGKIDLIIVDYLQLLFDNDRKNPPKKELYVLLFDELKQVATELNAAVLVTLQAAIRLEWREYYERYISEEIQPLWLLCREIYSSQARLEAVQGENAGKIIPLTFNRESLQLR